jgi:hypothetical protein
VVVSPWILPRNGADCTSKCTTLAG